MKLRAALPLKLILAVLAFALPLVQAQAFADSDLHVSPKKVFVKKGDIQANYVEKNTDLGLAEPFLVEASESKEKEFERRFNFDFDFLVLVFFPVAKPIHSDLASLFPQLRVLHTVQLRHLHTSLSPPLA